MCRDGAEGTATETATVKVDRELDHLVGRYGLTFVFRVRQSGIGKVEGGVEFLRCHGREWRIDHHHLAIHGLDHALGMNLVRFFFQMTYILCLSFLVLQAFLMAVQHDVIFLDTAGDLVLATEKDCLRNVSYLLDCATAVECFGQGDDRLLTHTIEDDVGTRITKNTFLQLILPVVIMTDATHAGFNAAQ